MRQGSDGMKNSTNRSYFAVGFTAFCVLAAAILFFFLLFHIGAVRLFLGTLAHILRPIFIGMVIAFLLLPIHRRIFLFITSLFKPESLENRRTIAFFNFIAIILSMAVAFFLIYLLLALVLPQVYYSIIGLVQAFPGYINGMRTWIFTFYETNPEIQEAIIQLYESVAVSLQQWLNSDILPNLESITTTVEWIKNDIIPNVTGVVASVYGVIGTILVLMKDLLIALIVSFYLLMRKDIFAAQSKKIVYSIFPVHMSDLIVEEARNAYRIMSGFINGKLLDSLIIGIITLICCKVFQFPYPSLVALIIGVTNVIPFFGPFIGAIPCAFLILLANPTKCVYFVIFIIVLQQFDGNILGPKILGDSTGLASFWVLFSIILFSGLFGFAGMVLGVPVFAMLYSITNRLVRKGLQKHGLPLETDYYMGKTGELAKRD